MNLPATLADVAAAAGVSRSTASLVLNGRPGPSAATVAKVRAVAEDLGYRPDVRARRLRGARSHCVALLTTVPEAVAGDESGYSFQIALAVPLSRLLLARGYSMLLVPPLQDVRQLDELDMDAAVIVEPRRDEPLTAELHRRGVRTVVVGDVPGLEVDAVVDRGASGADVVLAHLRDAGARHIAVVLGREENSVTVNVRDHVRDHVRRSGEDVVVVTADVDRGGDAARSAARDLLTARPETDAVYAPTDLLALGVLAAARDLGRSVPGDLLVATNFNGPRALGAVPPLTALDLDMTAVAEACAGLIVECVAGGAGAGVLRRTVPRPGLVVRESTSPSVSGTVVPGSVSGR
ncbi:LacI family DNA-binding transcriptional regulator [Corynebacterium neomassiliense]|uniref:LacI family DNA-binding transcriptional regulator n=1 Tax=Corynebacterium neomassiliense TaxID=2079482 RepID=UPI00102FC3C8|nr:LacI family DNA-binding transcriptional regulator [Corynebacterium neomassiliense]